MSRGCLSSWEGHEGGGGDIEEMLGCDQMRAQHSQCSGMISFPQLSVSMTFIAV